MLIVVTADQDIRNWTQDPQSNSGAWGTVWGIPRSLAQQDASTALRNQINGLPPAEPICLSGHGNDKEIGDEVGGWTWTVADLARILANVQPRSGPLFIRACAKSVVNYSARLAYELEKNQAQPGLWCYGYRIAIDIRAHYPRPQNLDKDVDLQGTQVSRRLAPVLR